MLRMVVTDLDGTFLNSYGCTDKNSIETLEFLGKNGIVRTFATGRSPYSIEKVIPNNFPVDYIIFSSGAGIIRWKDKQIIHERHLLQSDTQLIINALIQSDVDFMVHDPIPHNHCFLYYSSTKRTPDFSRRIDVYNTFCQPYIPGIDYPNGATQVIAILPNDIEMYEILSRNFKNHKVIRTTSPLDGNSIWMEIFPYDVSKAYGIKWLCNNEINCNIEDLITIGNDFNDLDMLELTKLSFVVANAPNELKSRFHVVSSNDEDGFTEAVKKAITLQ